MENILFQEIISLNKEYSKKIGLENVFIIKKIFELSEEGKKITQNLIVSETEGYIKKTVSNLNELKKLGILEIFESQFLLNLENLEEFLKNSENTTETLTLKKIAGNKINKKEEKITQCVDWIMEETPFNSDELRNLVREFVLYRIKKPFSELACRTNGEKLRNYSNGNENIAIEIVKKAVASSWQAFYDLNEKEKQKLLNSNNQTLFNNSQKPADDITLALKKLGVE